jgi:ABC-type transporter Mla subunit MlaD
MKPFVIQIVGGDLGGINARLDDLSTKLGALMATVDDLVQAVSDLKAAVAPLSQAINDLEAKVTAALASVGLTPEQQAKVDAAFNDIKSVAAGVTAAVADATDNIDEGAQGGGPV